MDIVTGIVAIVSTTMIFAALPGVILSYRSKNKKIELEKMKYQKEILELEIEKQKNQIKLLEEENKKLDRIINEKWDNL
jgi:predicted RNase H-like nuclease (RuvC/YqgF family)